MLARPSSAEADTNTRVQLDRAWQNRLTSYVSSKLERLQHTNSPPRWVNEEEVYRRAWTPVSSLGLNLKLTPTPSPSDLTAPSQYGTTSSSPKSSLTPSILSPRDAATDLSLISSHASVVPARQRKTSTQRKSLITQGRCYQKARLGPPVNHVPKKRAIKRNKTNPYDNTHPMTTRSKHHSNGLFRFYELQHANRRAVAVPYARS